jgi:hypothetical protein
MRNVSIGLVKAVGQDVPRTADRFLAGERVCIYSEESRGTQGSTHTPGATGTGVSFPGDRAAGRIERTHASI